MPLSSYDGAEVYEREYGGIELPGRSLAQYAPDEFIVFGDPEGSYGEVGYASGLSVVGLGRVGATVGDTFGVAYNPASGDVQLRSGTQAYLTLRNATGDITLHSTRDLGLWGELEVNLRTGNAQMVYVNDGTNSIIIDSPNAGGRVTLSAVGHELDLNGTTDSVSLQSAGGHRLLLDDAGNVVRLACEWGAGAMDGRLGINFTEVPGGERSVEITSKNSGTPGQSARIYLRGDTGNEQIDIYCVGTTAVGATSHRLVVDPASNMVALQCGMMGGAHVTMDGGAGTITLSADNEIIIGSGTLSGHQISAGERLNCTGAVFCLPTAAPAAPQAGDTYFNAATNTLYVYNGTAWVSVALS